MITLNLITKVQCGYFIIKIHKSRLFYCIKYFYTISYSNKNFLWKQQNGFRMFLSNKRLLFYFPKIKLTHFWWGFLFSFRVIERESMQFVFCLSALALTLHRNYSSTSIYFCTWGFLCFVCTTCFVFTTLQKTFHTNSLTYLHGDEKIIDIQYEQQILSRKTVHWKC